MEIKNIILTNKPDGRLNNARLNLTKDMVDFLKLSPDNKEIQLEYKDKTIFLFPATKPIQEESKKNNGEYLLYWKTIIKATYEKGKNNFKILIPLPIIKNMNITAKNKNVIVELLKDKIKIVTVEESKEDNTMQQEKTAKVYMVSVKKGGSAKSFTADNIAHGWTILNKDKKALVLSSDTQNDHMFNLMTIDEIEKKSNKNVTRNNLGKITIKRGLKKLVLDNGFDEKDIDDNVLKDFIINARPNLDVIPLEKDIFKLQTDKDFREYKDYIVKFPKVINKLKKKYDLIIIDGIPVSDIDQFYANVADKFIIPIIPDEATIRGAINMIASVGADKVHAILISKYRNTTSKNEFLEVLDNLIKKTKIIYPTPVKELSQIEQLVKNKKTLFESRSKYLKEAQTSFLKIISKM